MRDAEIDWEQLREDARAREEAIPVPDDPSEECPHWGTNPHESQQHCRICSPTDEK